MRSSTRFGKSWAPSFPSDIGVIGISCFCLALLKAGSTLWYGSLDVPKAWAGMRAPSSPRAALPEAPLAASLV
jgi:hypothetical protein